LHEVLGGSSIALGVALGRRVKYPEMRQGLPSELLGSAFGDRGGVLAAGAREAWCAAEAGSRRHTWEVCNQRAKHWTWLKFNLFSCLAEWGGSLRGSEARHLCQALVTTVNFGGTKGPWREDVVRGTRFGIARLFLSRFELRAGGECARSPSPHGARASERGQDHSVRALGALLQNAPVAEHGTAGRFHMPTKLAVAPLWRRFVGYESGSPAPHSARSAFCSSALSSPGG
jgi:hypothetical protein